MWSIILYFLLFFISVVHFVFPKVYHSWSFEKTISRIPGPKTIPFFGTLSIMNLNNEGFFGTVLNLLNKYRPLLRIDMLGNYTVAVTEVDDAEILMNNKLHITKSDDYDILHPWLGTGLLTSTDIKWFKHRRMVTPAFHFGIIENYIDIFSKHSQVFVKKLTHHREKPAELNPLASLCTLDIICETAMGICVNAQHGGTKEYVSAVLEMSSLFQIRQLSPWLYRECLFALSSTGRRQKRVLSTLHGFTDKVIEEKTQSFRKKQAQHGVDVNKRDDYGVKKKISFLDLLVEIAEVEGNLTREEIREEVDTFMFEGHDTTAAAISWAIFELSLNQDIQAKVHEEQDRIFGDSDRDPTTADLAEMKYLEQVIKETLRLYPSVPLISRKLEKPVTLSGYEVPAGTNTAIIIYYIHRDPRLYPNPDKFDPDRFIPEKIAKRHPYSYIPFSAGPRNCIGQKFAMMEEKVILSHILRKLVVHPVTKRDEVHMMAELILRPKENIKVTFTERKTIL